MFFIFRADSKHECIEKFGKQPNARVIHDDDQLCTTEYSRIVPLENGEVKHHIQAAVLYELSKTIFVKRICVV